MSHARSESIEQEEKRIYRAAYRLFSKQPHWTIFFQRIVGVGGLIRRTFHSEEEMAEFQRSETYEKIQQMLGELRQKTGWEPAPGELTRVVTIRVPESVHRWLFREAHDYRTSVNKLCISKLLQFIDQELVPEDRWVPRGRRRADRGEPSEEVERA